MVELRLKAMNRAGVIEDSERARPEDQFYPPMLYYYMLSDFVKMDAYLEVLRRSVHPGMRVLHAGCGLGLFAIVAARLGADRVWAVDVRPVVHMAKALARANGVGEAVEFIRGDVLAAETASRVGSVDLVVSDFIGDEVFDEGILLKNYWLRKLYCGDGAGKFIPRAIHGFAVPIESQEAVERYRLKERGVQTVGERYKLDMRSYTNYVRRVSLQNDLAERVYAASFREFGPDELKLLGDPVPFKMGDLSKVDRVLFKSVVEMPMSRSGRLDGVLLFFRADLDEVTQLCSGPKQPPTHWPQLIYLSAQSSEVSCGELRKLSVAYLGGKGLVVAVT